MMKICKKCREVKDLNEFDIRSDRKNRHRSTCRSCRRSACRSSDKPRIVLNVRNKEEFRKIHGVSYNTYLKRLNPQHKLRQNVRKRLSAILKQSAVKNKTEDLLGCSINKLKIHLQLKFHRNPRGEHEYMSWDNYGLDGWEMDHIRPLASFDLTNTEEFKKACNYTNIQPLWKKDNRKKSSKYPIIISNTN